MKLFAVKVSKEGIVEPVVMPTDTLKFLQTGVGGYIECVSTVVLNGVTTDMWVNEEGLMYHLPINKLATQMHELVVGNEHACIVGDVVLTGPPDEEGRTTGLDLDELTGIITWLLDADGKNFYSPHFFLEA